MWKSTWTVIALLVATSQTALAYNQHAHKVVAAVAWQRLNDAQRQAIITILREHPRFEQDFAEKMPAAIASQPAAVQNQWIFCQAAYWPDIARHLPQFHRAKWHYINLPAFLNAEQAEAFSGNLVANTSFALGSDDDDPEYNAVQAVKNSLNIVNNPSESTARKAVHICWLLHVIPDLSQPLHGAALFTENLFPGGDAGGNKIKIRRQGQSGSGKKLHAVWDGLLGSSGNFNTILAKANEIIQAHSAEFNTPFVALPDDVWASESQALALQFAYGPLLDEIEEREARGGNSIGVIEVPQSYFQQAGGVVARQAVLAGVRLAGVLASTQSTPGGPVPLAVGAPGLEFPAVIAMRPAGPNGVPRGQADANQGGAAAPGRDADAVIEALTQRVAELEARLERLQSRPSTRPQMPSQPQSRRHEHSDHQAIRGTLRRASLLDRARAAAVASDADQCDCSDDEADEADE